MTLKRSAGDLGFNPRSRMGSDLILYQLGEDHRKYLTDKNIITPDSWDTVFPETEIDSPESLGFGDFDESKIKRDGGKFAKKEGSGVEKHSGLKKEETKKMMSKVPAPPPEKAVNYIKASVAKTSDKGYNVNTRTGENGEINAAVAWQKSKDNKSVFIETLGSMGKGGGKQMLDEVVAESEKMGLGGSITLFPVRDDDVVKFYMKYETDDGRFFDAHPSGNGQWLLPAKK